MACCILIAGLIGALLGLRRLSGRLRGIAPATDPRAWRLRTERSDD
jgi:hypothetical protein